MDLWIDGVDGVADGRMAAGTVDRHRDEAVMVDIGVVRYEAAMADGAVTTAIHAAESRSIFTNGHAPQAAIGGVAGGTGLMGLRIPGEDSIAGCGMTPGAVTVHTDHAVVVDGGVIVGKGAMAGGAVVRGAYACALLTSRQAGEGARFPMALTAGHMQLGVGEADGDPGGTPRRRGMAISAVDRQSHPV